MGESDTVGQVCMKQTKWFSSPEFDREYKYSGELGAICSSAGTKILLWAPTAQSVFLHLYPAGDHCHASESLPMTKGERGVWYFETVRNLHGVYYDFDVSAAGETHRTADPYARACGVNGSRSMVVDLSQTDPDGWCDDRPPEEMPEQVIYELHVKDFSWDPAGGFDPADRGKFTALCRTGTTLNGDGIHPTGLDYLKQLGITHIQLMPVYDYGSVDEINWEHSYNWGYDPVNYNVPEGSYSSDPYHGEVRIRQLKEAVQALHKNGFRVIMDVVYNHTYHVDSWLERTVPGYYYRRKENGASSNGSGCGNDIASERSMCAKYILDSVLYWAEEYHMDGFRFDLMGLLDKDLMESIRCALDQRFGPGQKLIYGEPWRAGDTALSKPTTLCDKASLKQLDDRIGAFCDNTRDAIKGNQMDLKALGFVNGGGVPLDHLCRCITGWAGQYGPYQTPNQTISYLSCHDDWTLWDKLVGSMDPNADYTGHQKKVLRANRMAAALLFGCQGRIFFLAGEEFARTKMGIKNSYCSDSRINQLDWKRAWENHELVDYYRGLIELRQQLPALQDKSAEAYRRILWARQVTESCVAVCLDNSGQGSRWKQILMLVNGSDQPQKGNIPEGKWQRLADADSSFLWQEKHIQRKTVTAKPYSVIYLGLL
jgi:pullulanase